MIFDDIIHFPTRHEALGVWAGAAASVAVGIVAVVVTFLQDRFVQRGELRKAGMRSLTAAVAAMNTLNLIDDLTKDLFERQRTDARDLASRWSALPFEERRQIVESITERVVVGKGEVEIALLYSPSREDPKKATHAQGFSAAMSWKRAG